MNGSRSNSPAVFGTSPKATFMRRTSSGADGNIIAIRGNVNDMREHLKHLGPSNLASRPKTTRYNTVKIKPGHVSNRTDSRTDSTIYRDSITEEPYQDRCAPQGGEGEGLIRSAGKEASDGVQALQQGYGTLDRSISYSPSKFSKSEQTYMDGPAKDRSPSPKTYAIRSPSPTRLAVPRQDSFHSDQNSDRSSNTLGSLHSSNHSPTRRKRGAARSGSITENIIEAGGVRKVILETNGSGDERATSSSSKRSTPKPSPTIHGNTESQDKNTERPMTLKGEEVKKKRRRQRKKKGGRSTEESSAA
jgi:metal transporter CNNM